MIACVALRWLVRVKPVELCVCVVALFAHIDKKSGLMKSKKIKIRGGLLLSLPIHQGFSNRRASRPVIKDLNLRESGLEPSTFRWQADAKPTDRIGAKGQ